MNNDADDEGSPRSLIESHLADKIAFRASLKMGRHMPAKRNPGTDRF